MASAIPARAAAVGFAVAGGRSRRMGRDKALLAFGSTTLLDHAVARLRQACALVRILSGPERRYEDRSVPVVTDIVADAGPLAGIHAGLAGLSGELGLFLAIDLPFVPVALLAALLAAAKGFDAVVPAHAAGEEPLCAVYGPACLDPIRRHLEAGHRKVASFWGDVRLRTLGAEEIARFGDPATVFRNVNAPSDYAGLTER